MHHMLTDIIPVVWGVRNKLVVLAGDLNCGVFFLKCIMKTCDVNSLILLYYVLIIY